MDNRKRVIIDIIGALLVLAFGTIGYVLIEGWNAADAFFMTITTVTTVGYGQIHPLSPAGMAFTSVLIIAGVSYFAYVFATVTRIVVGGQLRETMGRRKLVKKIGALRGHYIICGFGRIGGVVAAELAARALPFVIIENDPEQLSGLDELGYLYVAGRATEEGVLRQAGIGQARGVISAVRSDADNVFIVLTARGLNPDLFILSRAEEEVNRGKLLRAGADKVVLPYRLGGRRMAEAVARPAVSDFVDLVVHGHSLELRMEEVQIAADSTLVGHTLVDSAIKADLDLLVVAIRRSDGQMVFNPRPQTRLSEGDTLIVLGEQGNLKKLEAMAAS
ncbi:MAG: potassium channel protein [Pseudomonadota bacterium]